jgi:hypothetical protein
MRVDLNTPPDGNPLPTRKPDRRTIGGQRTSASIGCVYGQMVGDEPAATSTPPASDAPFVLVDEQPRRLGHALMRAGEQRFRFSRQIGRNRAGSLEAGENGWHG